MEKKGLPYMYLYPRRYEQGQTEAKAKSGHTPVSHSSALKQTETETVIISIPSQTRPLLFVLLIWDFHVYFLTFWGAEAFSDLLELEGYSQKHQHTHAFLLTFFWVSHQPASPQPNLWAGASFTTTLREKLLFGVVTSLPTAATQSWRST